MTRSSAIFNRIARACAHRVLLPWHAVNKLSVRPMPRGALFASTRAVCLVMLLSELASFSCNVPVFRYALERWPAEPYEVFLFHRGPLGTNEESGANQLVKLADNGGANVDLRRIDITSRQFGTEERRVWAQQTNASLPWIVVRAPESEADTPPVWAGPYRGPAIQDLIDSPARKEIAARLFRGDSAVWVLVESGDRSRDDNAAALLADETKKLEQTLQLPPPAADDPQLHAEIPLKIKFSTMRIAGHGAETLFVRMLTHRENVPVGEPVVFPVFGRGRALAALTGPQLSAKIVQQAAAFMCGACSCEVKELNPGKDLLFAVDWDMIFRAPARRSANIGAKVEIPGQVAPSPMAARKAAAPNRQRGLRMLASAGLAISAIAVLLVGIALLRTLRRR